VNSTITSFQDKLGSLLSPEEQKELREKQERILYLREQIKQEVQKRSEEIGYDYEIDDYYRRLCISDEKYDEILQTKVLK
jgi:hypothetical protein